MFQGVWLTRVHRVHVHPSILRYTRPENNPQYSGLSNKRAAQIIVFSKKCSLHSLITSCTNYCFLEKMQPALLLTSCTNESYSKICQPAHEWICIFLLIPCRCIKLEYRHDFSKSARQTKMNQWV